MNKWLPVTIHLNESKARLVWRYGSGNTVEILDIDVDNECRRQGWGRKLLEHLFNSLSGDIRLVYAITRSTNETAQEFYEATRFRVIAPLRRFYNEPGEEGERVYGIDAIMYGRLPKGPV